MKNNHLFFTLLLVFFGSVLSAQVRIKFDSSPYQFQHFEYGESDKIEIDYNTTLDSLMVEWIIVRALHAHEYENPNSNFISDERYANNLKNDEIAGPGIPLSLLPKLSKDLKIIPTNKIKLIKDGKEIILLITGIYYQDKWMHNQTFYATRTAEGWKRIPVNPGTSLIFDLGRKLTPNSFHQLFIEQKGNELITELISVGKNPFNEQLSLQKINSKLKSNHDKYKSLRRKIGHIFWWKKFME